MMAKGCMVKSLICCLSVCVGSGSFAALPGNACSCQVNAPLATCHVQQSRPASFLLAKRYLQQSLPASLLLAKHYPRQGLPAALLLASPCFGIHTQTNPTFTFAYSLSAASRFSFRSRVNCTGFPNRKYKRAGTAGAMSGGTNVSSTPSTSVLRARGMAFSSSADCIAPSIGESA